MIIAGLLLSLALQNVQKMEANLNNLTEVWKDIPNYESLYQASNLGAIKSKNKFNRKNYPERIMKFRINRMGYCDILLCKNGSYKNHLIHRLIAISFIQKIEGKNFINHKNGIKTDNRVENLEWVTSKENCIHAYKMGLSNVGSGYDNHLSKPVAQYNKAGEFIAEFGSMRQVEVLHGFRSGNICSVCKGKNKTAYGFIWRYAK